MNPITRTESQKTAYWKAFDRRRWGFLRWGQSRVQKALREQADPVMRGLEQSFSSALANIDVISKDPVERLFTDLYSRVGSGFASLISDGMEQKQEESEFVRFLREWIQVNGVSRISGITDTTRNRLRLFLNQSIENGLGIEEAARLLANNTSITGLSRARVIARTEIISASNLGSFQGARSTNLNLEKEWISTRDSRTRRTPEDKYDHFTIDGQRVPMDQPFTVPGIEGDAFLMFPGDPTGPAGSVIQCRCTIGYHPL